MEQTIAEFFHDFRQEMLVGAEANSTYQLEAFMEAVSNELIETGFVEGFEHCHYRAPKGMRVDGFWFNDEGGLDIFVADFECRREIEVISRADVEAAFKRVVNFFLASLKLSIEPDITTPEYGLVRQIHDRKSSLIRVNFYLFSERALSGQFKSFKENEIDGIRAEYHIWDITRLQRQRSSRGHKEALDINFLELFGQGISCLPANLGSDSYQSFLIVMPAVILSALYEKYSARLLEQNVRTFLQARAQVNKGIRDTIIKEPQMFFAYNNGITATAQSVETEIKKGILQITRITDLQIVNGGQTTASLFHTQKRDKADLSSIFVQMKLSVIDSEESESVVPRISEYANTQNKVNAADFFSNHPFHIRMESFSRRIWAPALAGAQRETKWFYERARGQYLDYQVKLTVAEQKRFKAEYPKSQMFTKTDLAKFENAWDDHPKWVNYGSQKNFAQYAKRIGTEWDKGSDEFNEYYYKRAVARFLIFRATEKLVSEQPWYNGGYRANIVAYAIAALSESLKSMNSSIDYLKIWQRQSVTPSLLQSLVIASKFAHDVIAAPPLGMSNISEWCKKDACWAIMCNRIPELISSLPKEFLSEIIGSDTAKLDRKDAVYEQKIDNGIICQKEVFDLGAEYWKKVAAKGLAENLLTEKDMGILSIAAKMPIKMPSEKQSIVLMQILKKVSL